MILPNRKDAVHKAWLYRVLINIVDCSKLKYLYFKGGTCAAMLGFLDRFSVDLDFDYVANVKNIGKMRNNLKMIFQKLDLDIKDESQRGLQFFLRYPTKANERNTLKIDISFPVPKSNNYKAQKITDIDRVIYCQDIETMFANKLVAILDRYEKHNLIAGRDVYDIHHFFLNNYSYNCAVIKERTGMNIKDFFVKLELFIQEKITSNIINQDLNMLMPYDKFNQIRKTLKTEILLFIKNEILALR